MLSFRQKIFLSYLFIFLTFAIFLYPLTITIVRHIHHTHLAKRVDRLIYEIKEAPSLQGMLDRLKERGDFIFFRVTLYDPSRGYLFDSHLDINNPEFDILARKSIPEIETAIRKGSAYEARYSRLFSEQMAYVAKRFTFQGKVYILRAAFPNGQIAQLTRDLTVTFVAFVLLLLLLFSFFAWFIFHYLTKPAYQILETIRPYQEGRIDHLPLVEIDNQVNEFGQLAETLNSLSKRLQIQIDTLTHEKNEKSAILESLIEGVIAVDGNLIITYMNRMAEIFLGIQHHELVGKPFNVLGYETCELLLKEAQQTRKPCMDVMKIGRKRPRVYDLVATEFADEEGAILVLQDKTSQHRVIEMGRDFVANASHELKTPITIIRGFAETLHDHSDLSREITRDITDKIVTNCSRMEILVKNFLTLAALDEGLPDSRLHSCNVLDIIHQARQTTLDVHPDASIKVETVGIEPFIYRLDYDLFLQAVLNLLDNAAKYSKKPAEITVRLIKGEEQWTIQIIDKGMGIPKEDLDRIFERFFAVDKSHSKNLGGSGLGLSIVEQIIAKHRGRIEVESVVGSGTTFIITLPALSS